PGSFGRVYADFMDEAKLDATGLVEAEETATQTYGRPADEPVDPEREWFGDRLRDMHDLWHVLTGYGRDEAGEAANLAFTFGQVRFRGIALILFGIAINPPPDGHARFGWLRYLYRAWRRGRRAAWLPAVAYERLFAMPLEEVRRALRIAPAATVHPGGIIVASVYTRPAVAAGAVASPAS